MNIAKRLRLEQMVTSRRLLYRTILFYAVQFNIGSSILALLANNISVFLFGLDSSTVLKYRTYHFIQYSTSPIYVILILTPVLFVTRGTSDHAEEYLANVLPEHNNPEAEQLPNTNILNAIQKLFGVEMRTLLSLNITSLVMLLDIIALNLPHDKVIVVKLLSEITSALVNLTLILQLRTRQDTVELKVKLKSESGTNAIMPINQVQVASNGVSSAPTVMIQDRLLSN